MPSEPSSAQQGRSTSPYTVYHIPYTFHVLPAFTLVEILLTVSLLTILMGLTVPLYQRAQNANSLETATTTIITGIYRAQTLSRAANGDSTWGIKVETTNVTVFRGASYATRTSAFDELYPISLSTVSGTTEFVMNKISGDPMSSGTITLTTPGNLSRTITVNAAGMTSY